MENKQFNTPILYIIFNRPDKTRRSFDEIKKIRPSKLFITADGPRADRPEDIELCRKTRAVVQNIDWPCDVKTLFRDKNVGTRVVGPTAIRWFFDNVEQGIILEDDGLPNQSFFSYCEELLEKYKDNPQIMHIAGTTFQQKNKDFKCDGDYYFSRMLNICGWATWRRAWNLFDNEMKLWPKAKSEKILSKIFRDGAVVNRLEYFFDQSIKDKIDPRPQARIDWDGRWAFACYINNGLCITPRVNLVSNIGVDAEARIARDQNNEFANLPTQIIKTPLRHPCDISVNENADKYMNKYVYHTNLYWGQRIKWFFKSRTRVLYYFTKSLYYNLFKPSEA